MVIISRIVYAKKIFFWGGVGIVAIIIILIFTADVHQFLTGLPPSSSIHSFLQAKTKFQSSSPPYRGIEKNRHLIYVMGGSEPDLRERFRKASELLRGGTGEKILVFIQPGITAYDQALGRNLTNEEWTVRQLENLGIGKQDFDFAEFEEGFFGTFSECKNLLEFAGPHGYDHIHIVTSTYHTQRTWLTFSILSDCYQPISLSVHDAGDIEDIRYLLEEYGKLLFYRFFLLPWHCMLKSWQYSK